MKRPQIFLADDHRICLEAFRHLLEPKFEVVGMATDGRQMLERASKLEPDIVVLDIGMPHLNGFDAAKKLRKRFANIKIIFLTSNQDPDLAAESLRIGANGYLLKNCSAAELDTAIEVVMNDGTYVTPEVTRELLDSLMRDSSAEDRQFLLSVRQREVLQLLVEGKTMKEAAKIMCITPRTVAFHKYKMMQILNLDSNSQLIQFALKNGLGC